MEINVKPDPRHGKFNIKSDVDFCVNSYMSEAGDNRLLLSSLKEIADLEKGPDKNNRCKNISKGYIRNLGKEFVNSLLINDHCLRYMFDIISENSFRKLNILEFSTNFPAVMPKIAEVVEKFSLLKFKNKILLSDNVESFDKEELNESKIQLYPHDSLPSMVEQKSQDVVVGSICTSTFEEVCDHIRLLSSVVDQKGFILLFHKTTVLPPEYLLAALCGESINLVSQDTVESLLEKEDLVVVSKIFDDMRGSLYLLRHTALAHPRKIISMTDTEEWLTNLKSTICDSTELAWIVPQESPYSGVIGMVNCLRQEPGGDRIRCVYIPEKNKNMPANFSFEDRVFQDVLKKDLVMNVYKEGAWGSFRHVRKDKEMQHIDVDCSYLDIKKYGDLSTLTWTESAMNYMQLPDSEFVHIYYSALNFKDVMLATGKISVQTSKDVAGADSCVLGFEFSGKTKLGKRVAGMCKSRGLATATQLYPEVQFEVPDNWSLEEAATVPVVYTTCFYALLMRANLQPKESILIHSGAGGIGTAAINIALSMQCEVFTTVGTDEKRKYLLETFPELKNENIGCSRDTTFEDMIMDRTVGKGVNVVLNSLADEKFYASVRCVSEHGRFVEIGKYDLAMNHKIGLKFFLKNITFHGVFLDMVLSNCDNSVLQRLSNLLKDGIQNGVVKPLKRTVFQRDEAEKAFRYMGSGVHMGKVLLKIRDEEKDRSCPTLLRLPAKPMTYFYSRKVYIVIGGLGGFGIELCKWLMQKGANKIILTTRYGARTPYHDFCLKRWKTEGYKVIVSTRNVSKKEDASLLLREAASIGPVGGIFNSAVVLHDAFLENAKWEDFKEVCAPKADATLYLDVLSRCMCPELDHFVCFSSISCGKGNAGQMSYGYANSVMERVCERRRADGFPGLAIQWGIIGEVGVVHRHMGDDAMIAGVGAQKVQSCLNVLDVTSQLKRPVVSSYVIKDSYRKLGDQGDILQQLAKIFGLKDASEFNSMRSFAEMGVDSMIGVEVKHLLETTCDITLSMHEIQDLKLADIKALVEKMETEKANQPVSSTLVSTLSCINFPKSNLHPNAIERLNDVTSGVPVFILDIESGDISNLRKLGAQINQPVFALLLTTEAPLTNVEALATWFLEKITSITNKDSRIVAHLSAGVVALELALQLHQRSGRKKSTLTVLGGTSNLMKVAGKEAVSSNVDILGDFVENYIPSSKKRLMQMLICATSMEQQVRSVVEVFSKYNQAIDKAELTDIITCHVKTTQAVETYLPTEKLQSDLLVIEDSSKLLANDVAEVQTLMSEVCSGKVSIQRVPEMNDFGEDSIQKLISILKPVLI